MSPDREPTHRAVLSAETLRLLNPMVGETWVDCTVGAGGHSRLIGERLGNAGRLIGLDQDPTMLDLARMRLSEIPITLLHANFDQLPGILSNLGIGAVDGVLADLGFCSDQLGQLTSSIGSGRQRLPMCFGSMARSAIAGALLARSWNNERQSRW
jgi:16S rRNA (cytosine1402-N4)-methyltransferase